MSHTKVSGLRYASQRRCNLGASLTDNRLVAAQGVVDEACNAVDLHFYILAGQAETCDFKNLATGEITASRANFFNVRVDTDSPAVVTGKIAVFGSLADK